MIETQRLYLRQWQNSDLEDFAFMNADPQVMAFFPHLLKPAQSIQLAQRMMADIQVNGWGFWAIEIKATNSFAGFVGLGIPTADLPFSPCVEIAWRLMSKYWGRGYATEAASAALKFAFNVLQLDEVVSFTAQINKNSRKVMVRIGMHYSGETFDHPALKEGHLLRPHVLYRIRPES